MSDVTYILVTGGVGYIGSHIVVELVNAGYTPVIIDIFANAVKVVIERMEKIVDKQLIYHDIDILNKSALDDLFAKYSFYAVIHLAGLKAMRESINMPIEFYKVNVFGTLNIVECMKEHGVNNLMFSSSGSVYGTPQYLPIDEKHAVGGCLTPYGKSKYFIEEILRDVSKAEKNWNIILFRYFNPVGSHKSGLIGEDPRATNLMSYVAQVAIGRKPHLSVFGGDYDTHDGTGVRDYVHVVDLALGHIAALKQFTTKGGLKIYNLGSGKECSVLDMVRGMEKASGKKIPYKIVDRKDGDVGSSYSDATLIQTELGWKPEKNYEEMFEDLWRWQKNNPEGYETANSI
uniref:UDP-glucose 4-epimerase n=1 Tax=Saccoglossus kowalevskii TaxID=10224 RepID=A0ABM0MVF1_SACKO|nr:PREDICTED: UDP-glucose 4-epimerase-like [Saccoglossus kowalevskii]